MEAACESFVNEMAASHDCFKDIVLCIYADWAPDEPPVTLLYASLGRGVFENFNVISTPLAQEIFSLVEKGFTSGNPALRTAIGAGFLEALAAKFNDGQDFKVQVFSLLGAESARHVKAWLGMNE